MLLEEYAKLEITLPNGTFYTLFDNDIIDNSLQISAQCVDGNTFSLGCVSSAQLSVSVKLKHTNRYAVIGAKVKVFSKFSDADWIPRGIFTITSATRYKDIYNISASDNMIWLDKSAYSTDENGNMCNAVANRFSGSIYNPADAFIILVNEICNLNAQDRTSIIKNMVNCDGVGGTTTGARDVSILDSEEPENVRDYISYLAEHMAGFAYADGEGKICLKRFYNGNPTTAYEIKYSDCEQDSFEVADFKIDFHELESRFFNGYGYSVFHTDAHDDRIKIKYVIDNNPFQNASLQYVILDYGQSLDEMMGQAVINNIYSNICNINYRPFSLKCHVQHYFALGDSIALYDENGNLYYSVITNITWKYRGGQQISCAGEDTRILSKINCQSSAKRLNQRTHTAINRLEGRVKALEEK